MKMTDDANTIANARQGMTIYRMLITFTSGHSLAEKEKGVTSEMNLRSKSSVGENGFHQRHEQKHKKNDIKTFPLTGGH